MGRQDDKQGQLLYQFNLEEKVPEGHLLRGIDRFLDLSQFREHLKTSYSHWFFDTRER